MSEDSSDKQASAQASLSASQEDYLEAIYWLAQEHGVARVSHIAERLKVNKSSVSGALKNLSAKGYIDYDPYQFIRLRPTGEKVAKDISRRHEALRRFFVDILGVDDVLASETACKMEHHLDPAVLEPLVKYLEQTRAAALSDGSDR